MQISCQESLYWTTQTCHGALQIRTTTLGDCPLVPNHSLLCSLGNFFEEEQFYVKSKILDFSFSKIISKLQKWEVFLFCCKSYPKGWFFYPISFFKNKIGSLAKCLGNYSRQCEPVLEAKTPSCFEHSRLGNF